MATLARDNMSRTNAPLTLSHASTMHHGRTQGGRLSVQTYSLKLSVLYLANGVALLPTPFCFSPTPRRLTPLCR